VVGDLNTWGWVALCIGVAQWAVGLGIVAIYGLVVHGKRISDR
jgi:hypothetical protein